MFYFKNLLCKWINLILEKVMDDHGDFQKELQKLSFTKNLIIFVLFPFLMIVYSLLISYFFNTNNFSYISVLVIISFAIGTLVMLGAYLFSVIQDEAQIKNTSKRE